MASVLDKYLQWCTIAVNGVAAATGNVIARLTTGISNLQKVAWAVRRVEWDFPPVWISEGILIVPQDHISLALTNSSDVNQSPNFANPALLDLMRTCGRRFMTGVGLSPVIHLPIVHDFSDDILMLPQNVYLYLGWSVSGALTTAAASCRVWYREVELGPADWYDLLQLRLPLGAI